MFADFNQTIRSKSQTARDFRRVSSIEKLLPTQRREKLKELLISKFMKKYGVRDTEDVLEAEINKFIKNERLSDKELKSFDARLHQLIFDRKNTQRLKDNLSLTYQGGGGDVYANNDRLPEINRDNISVVSGRSKMSGISRLSNFSDMDEAKRAVKKASYKEFKEEADKYNQKYQNTLNLEGDNWGAINKYNQKMFEEERKTNKMKDKEVKRRMKEDLDIQVRAKMLKHNDELQKDKEFDDVVLQHVDNLNKLEREKEAEIKRKILKEKECRDLQMKDEIKKRKIEAYKNKKFEKEVVKKIKEEIAKEKQDALDKKEEERKALMRTLAENETRKITMEAMRQEERDVDYKSCLDMQRVADQREKDRTEYFKVRERKSGEANMKAIETVVKGMEVKNKEENEAIKQFEAEREQRAVDQDNKRLTQEKFNKVEMKKFLDLQVEEKQRFRQYEKAMDEEQARIWKIDTKNFFDQEKDWSQKIRKMNVANLELLKQQILTAKDAKRVEGKIGEEK